MKLIAWIKNYWIVCTSMITIAGLIYTYGKHEEGRDTQLNTLIQYADKTEERLKTIESAQGDLLLNQKDLKEQINLNSETEKAISNAIEKHLKSDKRYEELFQFQQEMLNEIKKNNGFIGLTQ